MKEATVKIYFLLFFIKYIDILFIIRQLIELVVNLFKIKRVETMRFFICKKIGKYFFLICFVIIINLKL